MSFDAPDAQGIFEGSTEFWTLYIKGRPSVPQSYFDTIFDYHASHGGKFDVAHDVGAGGGIHSGRLLDKFQSVILSDPWEKNIGAAKSYLQAHADRCTFKISSLENTMETESPQSVDLVFGQFMWHYTQSEKALAAVAHQLKPGGTMAISFASFPVFRDPRVWNIWTRMFRGQMFDQLNMRGGPYGSSRSLLRSLLSRLDAVPLPEDYFQPGAIRIKMKDPLGPGRSYFREALIPEEFKDDIPHWSEVGENDIVRYMEETEEWTFRVGVQGMRDISATYPHDENTELNKKLWGEMEELLGDSETEAVWPYSLILATRR